MHKPSLQFAAGVGSIALGSAVVLYNMSAWASHEYFFAQAASSASFVQSFYLAESISVFLLLLGFLLFYRSLRAAAATAHLSSLSGVVVSALSDRGLRQAAVVTACLYGVLYGFTSSILVFQPGVDFATYGAAGDGSWTFVPCCGVIGTVPKLILYLPSIHFAVQLVPLSLLLLFVVSPLVGLNISVALFSTRSTIARLTGKWAVACGAAVGLFTACPTCAGLFLAESVGGVASTTLAIALAPYQVIFIAVSIPLLLAMPLFFAMRIRKAYSQTRARLPTVVEGAATERPLSAGKR